MPLDNEVFFFCVCVFVCVCEKYYLIFFNSRNRILFVRISEKLVQKKLYLYVE